MSKRSFGVELEVIAPLVNGYRASRGHAADVLRGAGLDAVAQDYNHATSEQWKVVPDGSVYDGFEIVSPVLIGGAGLEALAAACVALTNAGYTVNHTTGVHVHVDARDFDMPGLGRVIRQFLIEEHNFDAVVAASRLDNSYCRSNMACFGSTAQESTWVRAHKAVKHSAKHMAKIFGTSRYLKLNLLSLWRHHTIEFRQHQGCLDAVVVCRWVRLVTTFVDAALATNNLHPRNATKLRVEQAATIGLDATAAQVAEAMLVRFAKAARRKVRREIGPNALAPRTYRNPNLRCRDTGVRIAECRCTRHNGVEMPQ